MMLFDTNAPIP